MNNDVVEKSRASLEKKVAATKKQSTKNSYGACDASILVGARAYYAETLENPSVEGLELLYGDGTSTKCGNCTLLRTSDLMPFARGEHIVGIDFREGDDKDKIVELCLYTSHPEGRHISFYIQDSGDDEAVESYAHGEKELFVGVYDHIVGEVGEEFTCKGGKRVTGVVFQGGKIAGMTQDDIPRGQNEEWWKESLGYETNEELRRAAEHRHLVGARASYATKSGKDYIIGLELEYSHGQPPVRWGEINEWQMSEEMPFEKDEHIVGISFDSAKGKGVTSLQLFPSNYEGRVLSFSTWFRSTSEEFECYVGVNGRKGSLSPKGKKFTCELGRRTSGIDFENGTIAGMTQEAIPRGHNEAWYRASCGYSSDLEPERKAERLRSRAKWLRAVTEARWRREGRERRRMMAEARRQKEVDAALRDSDLSEESEAEFEDEDSDCDSDADDESDSDSGDDDIALSDLFDNERKKRPLGSKSRKKRKKSKRSRSDECDIAMYRQVTEMMNKRERCIPSYYRRQGYKYSAFG